MPPWRASGAQPAHPPAAGPGMFEGTPQPYEAQVALAGPGPVRARPARRAAPGSGDEALTAAAGPGTVPAARCRWTRCLPGSASPRPQHSTRNSCAPSRCGPSSGLAATGIRAPGPGRGRGRRPGRSARPPRSGKSSTLPDHGPVAAQSRAPKSSRSPGGRPRCAASRVRTGCWPCSAAISLRRGAGRGGSRTRTIRPVRGRRGTAVQRADRRPAEPNPAGRPRRRSRRDHCRGRGDLGRAYSGYVRQALKSRCRLLVAVASPGDGVDLFGVRLPAQRQARAARPRPAGQAGAIAPVSLPCADRSGRARGPGTR